MERHHRTLAITIEISMSCKMQNAQSMTGMEWLDLGQLHMNKFAEKFQIMVINSFAIHISL